MDFPSPASMATASPMWVWALIKEGKTMQPLASILSGDEILSGVISCITSSSIDMLTFSGFKSLPVSTRPFSITSMKSNPD